MEILYLVKCSAGSWDSYHEWIGGVFDNIDLANDLINELKEKTNLIKSNAPENPDYENYNEDNWNIYEKKYEVYQDYYFKHQNDMEYNGSVIIPYNLNESKDKSYWSSFKIK